MKLVTIDAGGRTRAGVSVGGKVFIPSLARAQIPELQSLPESVKAAIEAKINAEQESQKMRFVLDKEKQEADRKRVEAQGIADYQRILTASLTDKLLQYEQIKAQKEIATSPNAKVVIMNGKANTPLMLGQ